MDDDRRQNDEQLELVRRHVAQLMEHFESVQVFCTVASPDGDGTVQLNVGKGNWFARYGQVQYWLGRESPTPQGQYSQAPDDGED